MRPRPIDYQILSVVDQSDEVMTARRIVAATGKSRRYVDRRIARLVHPPCDRGEAWLERTPHDGFELTERVAEVLVGLRRQPCTVAASLTRRWIDRVLWPCTEADRLIDRAAIPKGIRAPIADPERAAWRQAGRVLPHHADLDEETLQRAWHRLSG